MERKKIIPALLICIVLFAAALGISALVSKDGVVQTPAGTTGQIVLSEILPGNLTYPAPDGSYADFIELKNLTGSRVDISGYMLSDRTDAIGYTFPSGTVLEPYGSIVCWCAKDTANEDFGSFGISRDGVDTIYLYNAVNVLVDQKSVPQTAENVSLIRQEDGSWTTTAQVTPGHDNTEEGYDAYLSSMGVKSLDVVISEVMSASRLIAVDGEGTVCDWVELYNPGSTDVVLDGAYLSDDPADPFKWQIGSLTIAPGEYALIRCTGVSGTEDASFALPRSSVTVVLSAPLGNAVCTVQVPQMGDDRSWALDDTGAYTVSDKATPGYENSEAGYEAWLSMVGAGDTSIIISEVMASNRSTVVSKNDTLCDWIELYNPGSTDAVLKGAYLSDDPEDRGKWRIPDMTLAPGERVVICCAGGAAAEGEADFALSSSGGTILITGSAGHILTSLKYPSLEPDRVYAHVGDDNYTITDRASPGYENTDTGAKEYRSTQVPSSGLIISEVMPSNNKFLLQSNGEYYDWIELKNVSDVAIDLSNYTLSNDPKNLGMFALPDKTLQPGEYLIIICSGDVSQTGKKFTHAPFTLSREECWVYLTRTSGQLADFLHVFDVPYQGSVGRSDGQFGTDYFTNPTPAAPNGAGVAFISDTPVVKTADGVFNDVTDISVVIEGENVRYTTDGSIPTEKSSVYSGPISLTATTVLRIASFEEGKLPSDVVTKSYIINENHTLPVLSLTADPDEVFGYNGIYVRYTRDIEIPANLTLYEGEEGFSIDCGLEMFGHTALEFPKKGFKVNFRSRYGAPYLGYPIYGEDAPQIFESLCIRAGQDYPQAIFRDELFTGLCLDFSDKALAQHYKFCILYINGEYWGIYSLKEAFCDTYFSQRTGVSEDSVEIVQAPADWGTEIQQVTRYGKSHDMTLDENYEYLCTQIDMDSLVDWMVMQAYSNNNDIEQNLRYFRSPEIGNKWHLAFYDQDWGFYYHQELQNLFSETRTKQYLNLTRNIIKNKQFRQKFLERLSEAYYGVLSDENVMKRIDDMAAMLEPEIDRERDRWDNYYENWLKDVQYLRNFIGDGYHWDEIIAKLRTFVGLTDEEAALYFGR